MVMKTVTVPQLLVMRAAVAAGVGLHVDTTACFLVSVVFGRGIYSDSHKATG